MSDLYTITVVARDAGVLDLRVDIVHPDVIDVPASPSFAALVIEDEWGPGAAAFKAWWRAWADREPTADPSTLYQRIEALDVAHLPREQSAPPTGMTEEQWESAASPDDAQGRSLLGSVTLRVTVSDPGSLAHLAPGMRWSSTAWDEAGEGPTVLGLDGETRAWSREGG